MLDIDLEFSIDMLNLYKQFDKFSESEVIGCGVTQTPFYFKFLQRYKKIDPGLNIGTSSLRHNTLTSDTHVGGPGRYQGLNTGVLLLDLEKMRNSSLYINTTSPDVITRLRNKYQLLGSVGDQDWLTLGKSLLFHIILFYFLKPSFLTFTFSEFGVSLPGVHPPMRVQQGRTQAGGVSRRHQRGVGGQVQGLPLL